MPARHRHLPPGEPRISRPDRLDRDAARRHHRRLSRHPRRHRQPHHHGQRPRRPRLGRRRHRGRGRHARPARRRCCIPEVVGFKLTGTHEGRHHRHRPRAHRHADAAQEGRGRASSSNSTAPASTTCRWPTAPPSPTWPPNTAPPAASSPSTTKRSRYLALTGRDEAPHRAGRSLCQGQGMWRDAGTPDPGLHRHARPRPRRRSCPRSPARSARRTASPLSAAKPGFASRARDRATSKPGEADQARRRRRRRPTTSATATSSSPRSPPAPTPRTLRADRRRAGRAQGASPRA